MGACFCKKKSNEIDESQSDDITLDIQLPSSDSNNTTILKFINKYNLF